MRFRPVISMCLLVFALSGTPRVSAAEPDAMPEVGKLTLLQMKIGKVAGVVRAVESDRLTIWNLKVSREDVIKRSDITRITIDPSDQELIPTLRPSQVVAYRFSNALPAFRPDAKVAAIDGGTIYLNVGESSGISNGEEFLVSRTSGVIKDPVTQKVIGSQTRRLGRVVVYEVSQSTCKARLADNLEVDVAVGDDAVPAVKAKPIAVLPLTLEDGSLTNGGVTFADELTAKFTDGGFVVCERAQLVRVLEELKLQQLGIFDVDKSRSVGQQLGASCVIIGRITPSSNTETSYNVRAVDVATGRVLAAVAVKTASSDGRVAWPNLFEALSSVTPLAGDVRPPMGDKLDCLQSIAKLDRHVKDGKWAVSEGVLENLADLSVIDLGINPPNSYSIELDLKRSSGNQSALLYLPVGDNAVHLNIAALEMGGHFGLQMLNGTFSQDNETASRVRIVEGQWMRLAVHVARTGDKASIRVELDGKEIMNWRGNANQLSAQERWAPVDKKVLGLTVLRSRFSFRNISLTRAKAK